MKKAKRPAMGGTKKVTICLERLPASSSRASLRVHQTGARPLPLSAVRRATLDRVDAVERRVPLRARRLDAPASFQSK